MDSSTVRDLWAVVYGIGGLLVLVTGLFVEGRIRISYLHRDQEAQKKNFDKEITRLNGEVSVLKAQAREDQSELRDQITKILLTVRSIAVRLKIPEEEQNG